MAISLLAGIDRHVAPERVERLLADADGTPIAGGANDAGTREAVNNGIERRIERRWRSHLVADQPALRRVTVEAPSVKNRLPRNAIAGESATAADWRRPE